MTVFYFIICQWPYLEVWKRTRKTEKGEDVKSCIVDGVMLLSWDFNMIFYDLVYNKARLPHDEWWNYGIARVWHMQCILCNHEVCGHWIGAVVYNDGINSWYIFLFQYLILECLDFRTITCFLDDGTLVTNNNHVSMGIYLDWPHIMSAITKSWNLDMVNQVFFW